MRVNIGELVRVSHPASLARIVDVFSINRFSKCPKKTGRVHK